MITVLAALIIKDNKVLIAKRLNGNDEVVGKWEFPGGKLEEDEEEERGIEREIKEELDITVKTIKYITNNVYSYPNKCIDLKLYECKYISGNFEKLTSHSEYKFIPISELLDYNLCPADVELAKHVINNYN